MSSYAGLQLPGAVAAKAGMSTATSARTPSTDKVTLRGPSSCMQNIPKLHEFPYTLSCIESPAAATSVHTLCSHTIIPSNGCLQMIQGCIGYTYKNTKGRWHAPLDYLIRAVVWFAIRFLPSLSTMLLTSSAVHMPGLATSLLAKCPLQQAKYVLVKVLDTSPLL